MRIINGESVRDKILKLMRFTEHNHMHVGQNYGLRLYYSGYAAALRDILGMVECETTIGSVIGDNNINRLRVKEE